MTEVNKKKGALKNKREFDSFCLSEAFSSEVLALFHPAAVIIKLPLSSCPTALIVNKCSLLCGAETVHSLTEFSEWINFMCKTRIFFFFMTRTESMFYF